MALQRFHGHAVTRRLENDLLLSEPLLFPKFSCLNSKLARALPLLQRPLQDWLSQGLANEFYQRCLGEGVTCDVVEFALKPIKPNALWREPLQLRFGYVYWQHDNQAVIAFLPDLGLETILTDEAIVQQPTPQAIRPFVKEEIELALGRWHIRGSLRELLWYQRARSWKIVPWEVQTEVPTLKQIAIRQQQETDAEKSVLKEVGTNLSSVSSGKAFENEATVEQLAQVLTARQPQSVLLVGPSGVGKTAAVYELVRQREQRGLGNTPFWATSGSRLVAGMSGFGMWQQRCQDLVEEARRRRAIVHVASLMELMEVGKSVSNEQGIASFLRPYLVRGDVVLIAECTEEQVHIIEKEDPALLDAFHQVKIKEPSPQKCRRILRQVAEELGKLEPLGGEVLDTIDRLHRRYATYSAYPGRPLRFLRNLVSDQRRSKRHPLTSSSVHRAFSQETGLPLVILDETVPLGLQQTESWFQDRVIGQPAAVRLIVDLLATIKAQLTRTGKPIASLLFIGPTGVGKTEMAKALATFLYQDPHRLTRFDMSEYADPLAVQRLVGTSFSNQGLLTSKVREQPFAVILFDEFEKAHPMFFDLLLQILGEGRLSDAAGRVADFCNSVIIMTSNLGAESFQRPRVGFRGDELNTKTVQDHFEKHVKEFLRPELFNRIDRIVPFTALSPETIHRITKLQLQNVRDREGIRYREVDFTVSETAIERIAAIGYDPRYGARPLKRSMERELLAPMAHQLNTYGEDLPLAASVDWEQGDWNINVKAQVDEKGRLRKHVEKHLVEKINRVLQLRRETYQFHTCPATLRLRNDIYREELRLERERIRRQRKAKRQQKVLSFSETEVRPSPKLESMRKLNQQIIELHQQANQLEEAVLLSFYQKQPIDEPMLEEEILDTNQRLDELLLGLYLGRYQRPNLVSLIVYSEDSAAMVRLGKLYERFFALEQFQAKAYLLRVYRDDPLTKLESTLTLPKPLEKVPSDQKPPEPILNAIRLEDTDRFWQAPEYIDKPIGIAFEVRGKAAFPLLEEEAGKQVFVPAAKKQECVVASWNGELASYEPPQGVHRRGHFLKEPLLRTFDEDFGEIRDRNGTLAWTEHKIAEALQKSIQTRLHTKLRQVLR